MVDVLMAVGEGGCGSEPLLEKRKLPVYLPAQLAAVKKTGLGSDHQRRQLLCWEIAFHKGASKIEMKP